MFTNSKKMMKDAFEGGYAVPQFNINNLEWTKAILEACEESKSPVILGASGGAIKYMGGFNVVKMMVQGFMEDLNLTIPVSLHLDHGSFEQNEAAIKAGFTSVMYDGSHFPFEENFKNTQTVLEWAKTNDVSVEVEVGTLAGEEDGVVGSGDVANPEEVAKISELDVTMVAAGINNIHGQYPEGWEGLRFDVLEQLKDKAGKALVLHGGSGIPTDQIKKAISMGISKINVNTELQLVNAAAIKDFVLSGKIDEGKNFDPRKLLAPGVQAIKDEVKAKIAIFGSGNRV